MLRRLVLLAATIAALATAPAYADQLTATPTTYTASGGSTFTGLRPTALGLPQIGADGTIGAGELVARLIAYHDSGLYENDIQDVVTQAQQYLAQRLHDADMVKDRQCKFRFRKARGKLYKRVKVCKVKKLQGINGKPAIVLDIDETSLSNYSGLLTSNFTSAGLVLPAATSTGTAITPTLNLFKDAIGQHVSVFFITGRPSAIQGPTETNLRAVGYDNWSGLTFKPSGVTTEAYKAGERKKLEDQGYDIILNLGDQESDLDGGHADRSFKLPNPFYFISD